ncbi:hypothetical protein MUN82_12090 [Hymenobacter aerilatus]|uniref:Uncharacterized protein n=1 Tax=Hymenobacter aerilatus TaxID=2932251 RepID=A0A8T9SV94_9BACT|nr:hypothetical protein [Hymenobacter aerilatus]UOR03689.1 hypothetical protein MUN82_12090 [Hymenobacter aerilatus]
MDQEPQTADNNSTPANPTIRIDQDSQQVTSEERGDGTTGLVNNGSYQLKTDQGESAEMGAAPLHLHSAAKGDEDYLNGDDHKQVLPKPEQDKL